MNLGTGNRRQTMMAGVLGVLALGACIYIYEEIFGTDTPQPAPAPVAVTAPAKPVAASTTPAKLVGTTSAALDPTLHMDAMLVSELVGYAGVGRNIFSPASAQPISIPKPITPARPVAVPPPLPCPPNCPPPPPPPPIDLKLFGVATAANGTRQACLLQGDNVYLASAGDVVLRRYRVIAVDAKSIQVEDMQNNNKQTLPLLAN
jgi:hypothetical protein